MKHCDKCNIDVVGSGKYCPLCQGALLQLEADGKDSLEEEIFPYIPTLFKQYTLFFKILIFLSIIAIISSVTVNIMFHNYGWWSLFVVAGVGGLWMELYVAFSKRKNIPQNILYQTVLVSLLSVFWDWIIGWNGWSLDYVIPIICLSAMLAMVLSSKIMHLDVNDYMIYLIIGGLFGITPVVFLLLGVLNGVFMSLICVAASLIFLSAIVIFQGNKIVLELKRRLHL